jgi:uncharacterized OB-fold protein
LARGFAPTPTPDTEPFWQAAKEGRLVVQRCRSCRRHYFYPRSGCPSCGSEEIEWSEVSGHGLLVSYVINYRPMAPADPDTAQIIALVELDEGVRMLTNIVGTPAEPDALPLDAEVRVGFEPRGDWRLPVFHLVDAR